MDLELPLSWAVVYDTCIHSGPSGVSWMRRLFLEVPPARGGDQREWTEAYVRARYAWLASHWRAAVRKTVYRMRTFLDLIRADNWTLDDTFTVLGVTFP